MICSDADISDLVFTFFNKLRPAEAMIYINNPIKHYDDVTAYKLGLEKMLKQIKEKIKNDIPFIACFNTVALLNYVYDRVFDESKKKNFVVHTSEIGQNIDVKKWVGNFVFFSPKVVYGLDYNLQKSDVYVFIDDRYRTINPVQVVQQLTRQRQINDLYYCIDTAKSGPKDKLIYQTIEDVKEDKEAHKKYFIQLEVANWTSEKYRK